MQSIYLISLVASAACQRYDYKYDYIITMFIIGTSLELPLDFEKQYFDVSVIGVFDLGNECALVLEKFNERCY